MQLILGSNSTPKIKSDISYKHKIALALVARYVNGRMACTAAWCIIGRHTVWCIHDVTPAHFTLHVQYF